MRSVLSSHLYVCMHTRTEFLPSLTEVKFKFNKVTNVVETMLFYDLLYNSLFSFHLTDYLGLDKELILSNTLLHAYILKYGRLFIKLYLCLPSYIIGMTSISLIVDLLQVSSEYIQERQYGRKVYY